VHEATAAVSTSATVCGASRSRFMVSPTGSGDAFEDSAHRHAVGVLHVRAFLVALMTGVAAVAAMA
jgi:hypothetical protein